MDQRLQILDASEDTQAEFDRLTAEWKRETAHLSSPSMIAKHWAYEEIIGMGLVAIPLILRDLKKAPALWFMALLAITGASPTRPDDHGNIDAMRVSWLDWGERNHYI